MRFHCLMFLFFIAMTSHAQMTLDVLVEPKPLDFVIPVLEPELKAPIKSMAWVKGGDTIISYEADKKGNLIAQHNYSNNKRGGSTLYSYNGNLKTQMVYTDLSERATTSFKYSPSGKYLEWGKSRVITKKNLIASDGDFKWIFEYDKRDNLVKKYYVDAAKVKTLVAEYFYDDNNRLKEAMINGQTKSVFGYDTKGNLLSRTEAMNGVVSTLHSYSYDESGNVVRFSNNYYTAEYSYAGGKMTKCIYTLANGKQEIIDFVYKDKLLTEVTVQRNDYMSYSPFRLSRNHTPLKTPYSFRIEIIYDKFNNTKELKYYVDSVYKYSENYVIKYFK